jgi:hypothetical protein
MGNESSCAGREVSNRGIRRFVTLYSMGVLAKAGGDMDIICE